MESQWASLPAGDMRIALTYAYTRTVSAQNTDLEPVDDRVEVFGLGLKRGFGVELLGD